MEFESMSYQDSEIYREESESEPNLISFVEHEDGRVTVEVDAESPLYEILIEVAKSRGLSPIVIIEETIQEYCDKVIADNPHLTEILDFQTAFDAS